jgi:K+-transporting ATPase ATPase C chain
MNMKTIWISIRMLVVLTVLTGVVYPLLMTGLAQTMFADKANGSMIIANGKTIGSALIGQNFTSEKYFWSRPSAISYNPLPSSGTNQGPTNAALRDSVAARAARLGGWPSTLPADLLHASGSGLDPHISPAAAMLQLDRVATARGGDPAVRAQIESLVKSHIELPQFNLFGEERVNVLKLNLALDSLLER